MDDAGYHLIKKRGPGTAPGLEKTQLHGTTRMVNQENLTWLQDLPGQAQPGLDQKPPSAKFFSKLTRNAGSKELDCVIIKTGPGTAWFGLEAAFGQIFSKHHTLKFFI